MPAVLTNGCRTIEIVGICETLILAEGKLYVYTRYIIGKIRNVVNVRGKLLLSQVWNFSFIQLAIFADFIIL
jgi:hypothetical protein